MNKEFENHEKMKRISKIGKDWKADSNMQTIMLSYQIQLQGN